MCQKMKIQVKRNAAYKSGFYLLKLLDILGIMAKMSNTTTWKSWAYFRYIFHPFSIGMHLATAYNAFILLRTGEKTASNFSSSLTSVLSLLLWYQIHFQTNAIHSAVKYYFSPSINCNSTDLGNHFRRKILITLLLSFGILLPIVFAVYNTVMVKDDFSYYVQFWFIGYDIIEYTWLVRVGVFFCSFFYTAQQTLCPALFLLFYCITTLELGEVIRRTKITLSNNNSRYSLTKQSRIHKEMLSKVENHQKIFSFSLFLLLWFLVIASFTGFAHQIQNKIRNPYAVNVEGILYLYFGIVGVASLIYSASRCPVYFTEIRDLYISTYENVIEKNKYPMTAEDMRNLLLLKIIYKRNIPQITAWDIKLDKNLAFTLLGGMISYGFLIIQFKTE